MPVASSVPFSKLKVAVWTPACRGVGAACDLQGAQKQVGRVTRTREIDDVESGSDFPVVALP